MGNIPARESEGDMDGLQVSERSKPLGPDEKTRSGNSEIVTLAGGI